MKLYKTKTNNITQYTYGTRAWAGRGSASAAYAFVAKIYLVDRSIRKSIQSIKKLEAKRCV